MGRGGERERVSEGPLSERETVGAPASGRTSRRRGRDDGPLRARVNDAAGGGRAERPRRLCVAARDRLGQRALNRLPVPLEHALELGRAAAGHVGEPVDDADVVLGRKLEAAAVEVAQEPVEGREVGVLDIDDVDAALALAGALGERAAEHRVKVVRAGLQTGTRRLRQQRAAGCCVARIFSGRTLRMSECA